MQLGAINPMISSVNFKSNYEPLDNYDDTEFDYDLDYENDSFEKTYAATSPDELTASQRAQYDKKEEKINKNVSPWAVVTGGAAALALPKYGAKGTTVIVNSAAKIAQYVSTAAVEVAGKISGLFAGKTNPVTGKTIQALNVDKIINGDKTLEKTNGIKPTIEKFVSPNQDKGKVDEVIKDFTNAVFTKEKAADIQNKATEMGIVNAKGTITGLVGTGIAIKGMDIVSDEIEDKIVDPTQKRQALAEVQGLKKNPAEFLKVISELAS